MPPTPGRSRTSFSGRAELLLRFVRGLSPQGKSSRHPSPQATSRGHLGEARRKRYSPPSPTCAILSPMQGEGDEPPKSTEQPQDPRAEPAPSKLAVLSKGEQATASLEDDSRQPHAAKDADGPSPAAREPSGAPGNVAQFDTKIEHSTTAAVAVGTSPQAHGRMNMPGMTVHAETVIFAGATTQAAVPFVSNATEARTRSTSAPSARPTPSYPDAETRILSEKLADAQRRQQLLQKQGVNLENVVREVLDLKRQLRQGGQLRAGDSLGDGRYLLLESVGRGGFATVWRALDVHRNDIVAVKVLHGHLAPDSPCLTRFVRGAKIMNELKHDAVVRVIEPCAEDGGWHYFVMEYLAGGDMRNAVLEGRIGRLQSAHAMARVCDAVAFAHSLGIVHRDINPSNVVLNSSGDPKLTDFDLVGAPNTTGGTKTGLMGTVGYTDPECMGRPMLSDTRADVYSLAMTIIFGLRGSDLPLTAIGNSQAIIDQLPVGFAVRNVLLRATRLDARRERYQDAGALRDSLASALRRNGAAWRVLDWFLKHIGRWALIIIAVAMGSPFVLVVVGFPIYVLNELAVWLNVGSALRLLFWFVGLVLGAAFAGYFFGGLGRWFPGLIRDIFRR